MVNFHSFEIKMFCFVVAVNAQCGGYNWHMLTANSMWKSFSEI